MQRNTAETVESAKNSWRDKIVRHAKSTAEVDELLTIWQKTFPFSVNAEKKWRYGNRFRLQFHFHLPKRTLPASKPGGIAL
jgi:hypothetical protein